MNDRGWIPRCGLVYGDESAMTEPIQQVTGTQPSRLPSRSASARWLAFVIALMLFPRASELVSDLGHLLLTGHTGHSAEVVADDHEPHDGSDEHGCSGLFHTCRCCATPLVLAVAPASSGDKVDDGRDSPAPSAVASAVREGHRQRLFRPPAA